MNGGMSLDRLADLEVAASVDAPAVPHSRNRLIEQNARLRAMLREALQEVRRSRERIAELEDAQQAEVWREAMAGGGES